MNEAMDQPHVTRGFVLAGKTKATLEKGANLPFLGKPGNPVRNHFIAMCGEFVGTFLFLFFAFTGTQVANSQTQGSVSTTIAQGSNPAQLLYISLCFGFSLGVNAWVFFRISGGLFNPAVTFGMCLVGAMPWVRGGLIFLSQIIGGITAAGIVEVLFPGQLNVRTSLGAGTSKTQGLFIEMFLTTMLVFTIFMLAAEKSKATFVAPVGIGLSLFIAELAGVYYTGGSLNPARSFGPDVVLATFEDYHWIYWIGPFLGALVASGFYKLMKGLEYETANPGQDFDENETKIFDPETDVERPMVSVVTGGSISEPSRPISGDTLSGYKREETPLHQIHSRELGQGSSRPHAQASAGTTRSARRLSSPLPPIDAEDEKSTAPLDTRDHSNINGVGGEDIVHGGPHYSQTANALDPRVQREIDAMGTYQAGPEVEAGESRL
ncbi:MAG: hypothetical protein ASARMPRED_006521 [Alectoria sarmentosa]|nr:MAG: hypothetical protein ASARMPRED_006521 [Alectoria sarmentosa]